MKSSETVENARRREAACHLRQALVLANGGNRDEGQGLDHGALPHFWLGVFILRKR